jgi:hypothetical protein
MRDHLRHRSFTANGDESAEHYGYAGPPPIERMYLPVANPSDPNREENRPIIPRYWAWNGCNSAAALAVILLRLLNIPVFRLRAYEWPQGAIESGSHGGLDLPGESLAVWHVDDLFATTWLQDPGIEPAAVFNAGVMDYADYKSLSIAWKPSSAADSATRWAEFYKVTGRIAVRNATHFVFFYFWETIAFHPANDNAHPCDHPQKLPRFKSYLVDSFRFSDEEVVELLCDHEQVFRDKIAAFKAAHIAELASAPTETLAEQMAYNLYMQEYEEWERNR